MNRVFRVTLDSIRRNGNLDQASRVRTIKTLIIFAAAVVIIIGLYRIRSLMLPFIIGMVIAYIFNPVVDFFEGKGAPRVAGIAIVYIFIAVSAGVVSVYLFPVTIQQLERIADDLPRQVVEIQDLLTDAYERYNKVPIPATIRDSLDNTVERGQALMTSIVSDMIDSILGIFYQLPSLLLSPILAFYFSRDRDWFRKKVVSVIPARNRDEFSNLLGEMDVVVSGFIRGQLLVALIVGFLIGLGLWVVGIEFAFLIGILAGFLDLIPYFGPLFGALPAVSLAVLKSPVDVIYVALVFVVVNQIEAGVISPKIVSAYVGLHPLVVIFSILVGGYLLGLIGMILAVPLTGVIRILIRYLWIMLIEQQ